MARIRRFQFQVAADRMQRLALIALWLLGMLALWAWYSAAMSGHVALAAAPDRPGSTLGPVPAERGLAVQVVLVTLGALTALASVSRPGLLGPLAVGSVLAFLFTAVPWLMIQRLAVGWEVCAALPAIVLAFAAHPAALRLALGAAVLSLLGASISFVQPGLLGAALMLALCAIGLAGSSARLNRLGELLDQSAQPVQESGSTHASWMAIGALAGMVVFAVSLPLADVLLATVSGVAADRNGAANGGGDHPDGGNGRNGNGGNGNDGNGGGTDDGSGGSPDGSPGSGTDDGSESATLVEEDQRQLAFSSDMSFGDRTGGADDSGTLSGLVFTVQRLRRDGSELETDDHLPPGGTPPGPDAPPMGTPDPFNLDTAPGAWFASMYWQIDALSIYEKGRWSALLEPRERVRLDIDDGERDGRVRRPFMLEKTVTDVSWRVRLGPIGDRICPVPGPVYSISAPAMTVSAEDVWRFAGDTSKGVSYHLLPGETPPDFPRPHERHLEVPPHLLAEPEFLEWVQSLVAQIGPMERTSAFATAMVVAASFRGGEYQYDVRPGIKAEDDPNIGLLRHKVGYCQHYASLFALGCRALGLPARVAVGFANGEWDNMAQRGMIYSWDAHAWGQVYIEGRGWVDLDPLVESGVPQRFGAMEDPQPDAGTPPVPDRPDTTPDNTPDNTPPPANPGGEMPQGGGGGHVGPSNSNTPAGPVEPDDPPVTPPGNTPGVEFPDTDLPALPTPTDPDYPEPPDVDPTLLGGPKNSGGSNAAGGNTGAGTGTGNPGDPDNPDPTGAGAVNGGNGNGNGNGANGRNGGGNGSAGGGGRGGSGRTSVLIASDPPAAQPMLAGTGVTVQRLVVIAAAFLGLLILLGLWRWFTSREEERERRDAARAGELPFDVAEALARLRSLQQPREQVIQSWHVVHRALAEVNGTRARREPAERFAQRLERLQPGKSGDLADATGAARSGWRNLLAPLIGRFNRACYAPWQVPPSDGQDSVADATRFAGPAADQTH